jgi:hypothetical protein
MDKRVSIPFLILILFQGLHSAEEYFGRLWEVFLPAKLVSTIISINPETGFLIFNAGLFIFGLWCWLFPIRRNFIYATVVIWFWIIIEFINGLGHPFLALYEGAYFPGVATAPILLILSVYLAIQLLHPGKRMGQKKYDRI